MKITLAVAAVLVVALGLYYGVFRSGADLPADLDVAAGTTEGAARPVPRPTRIAAPRPDSAVGGILSESIAQATAPRGSTATPPPAATARPADPLGGRSTTAGLGQRISLAPAGAVAGTSPSTGYGPPPVVTARDRPTTPAAPQYASYRVKSGDSMSSIALAWFGDASRWTLIARANPTVDPLKLQIGQPLRLPPKGAAAAAPPDMGVTPPPVPTRTATTHVVRAGDNLSWIADRYYGDIDKWRVIYRANRDTIGTDPDTLTVGTRLLIPDA